MPTLLPPDHPDAPRYWMHEQSGVLAPVVRQYLEGKEPLSPRQIGIMRAYLKQWAASPVWAGPGLNKLRRQIAKISTPAELNDVIRTMTDLSMDPL
jgi:hypothetical protein